MQEPRVYLQGTCAEVFRELARMARLEGIIGKSVSIPLAHLLDYSEDRNRRN